MRAAQEKVGDEALRRFPRPEEVVASREVEG